MIFARNLILLLPWAFSCAATPLDSPPSRNLMYEEENNRVIIKFKDDKSYNEFNTLEPVKSLEKQNAKVFMLSAKEVKEMELRDDVVMVVKDHKVYPPSDEGGTPVEILTETVPYGIDMVNALLVSDISSSNIGMCVVDSGYDMPHADLQQTDVTGTDGPNAPWGDDVCGHGTHVTGTIMALGGNNEGVVGVVRNGEMPLHVVRVFSGGFDGCWWSWSSDLVGAVQECVDAGSSVVNMSLGGSAYSSFEDTSFQDMADNGLLMIAAAGNGGSSSYSYPASYDSIVSVACLDENQVVAYFSQYNDQVEIAGPGVNTESTCPNGTYCTKSGTSMASPHVAGVAALVWSHFPYFTNYEIRDAMQATATDLGAPGRDDYYGHGLVNALALYEYLYALSGPQPSAVPSVSAVPSSSSILPTGFPSESSMPSATCFDLDIEILADNYASGETGWTLYDTDGTTVIDSGGYSDFAAYVLYEYTVSCLPTVCGSGLSYSWVIHDDFGDGLNWSFSDPGYFKVFVEGSELFGSSDGVNFGTSDTVYVDDCQTAVPSVSPTVSVAPSTVPTTASPTTTSMPTTICLTDGFMPISNSPGAIKLVPLSDSDGYSQIVDLGFDFQWLGGNGTTSQVRVTDNGNIIINLGDTSTGCCDPFPIGDYNQPRIAVVQENLDPSSYGAGDIWMKYYGGDFPDERRLTGEEKMRKMATLKDFEDLSHDYKYDYDHGDYKYDDDYVYTPPVADKVIISWEGVAFFGSSAYVNAQATLYPDGAVTICYGDGELTTRRLTGEEETKKLPKLKDFEEKTHDYKYDYDHYYYDYKYADYVYDPFQSFAAGMEGGENDDLFPNGPAMAYPLNGAMFDSNGISGDIWPTDRCYCFDPVLHIWESAGEPSLAPSVSDSPTSEPSSSPSAMPTLSDAPTSEPSSSPSAMPTLSVVPTVVASVAPSATPLCFDSTLNSAIGNGNWNCDVITANPDLADEMCALPAVASHCPLSCDTCPMYACEDSFLPLSLNGRRVDCEFIVNKYDDDEIADMCENGGIASTCRGTCGTCNSGNCVLGELTFVGWGPFYGLGCCEGDCDNDGECADGLVCHHRDSYSDPIPSNCIGEAYYINEDYCAPP